MEDARPEAGPRKGRRRRLVILGIIALIGVGGVLFYREFWLVHPVGSGPAGPAVPRESFEREWSSRRVRLIGMGDSVTAGFGASPGHSYFERLVRNTDSEFEEMRGICLSRVLPNLEVQNLAVSGSTSLEHVRHQLPKLRLADEDVFGIVVLTTGGNDIIHNYGQMAPREGGMFGATWAQASPWIDRFRDRLDGIVEVISDHFPGGCLIFLANIYDPTDGIGDIANAGLPGWPDGLRIHQAYNAIIRRCAESHDEVVLVDIHSPFIGHGIHSRQFWRDFYHADDPYYWYFDNLEDPNDRGYDAIRRLFLIEMTRTLPERLGSTSDPSAR